MIKRKDLKTGMIVERSDRRIGMIIKYGSKFIIASPGGDDYFEDTSYSYDSRLGHKLSSTKNIDVVYEARSSDILSFNTKRRKMVWSAYLKRMEIHNDAIDFINKYELD